MLVLFGLFAVSCMADVFISQKIAHHFFINYPKLWKSFGFTSRFYWFIPSAEEKQYNTASSRLAVFLKSQELQMLNDQGLFNLIQLKSLAQKSAIIFFAFILAVGFVKLH